MGGAEMKEDALRDKDEKTGFRGVKEKSGGRPKA